MLHVKGRKIAEEEEEEGESETMKIGWFVV